MHVQIKDSLEGLIPTLAGIILAKECFVCICILLLLHSYIQADNSQCCLVNDSYAFQTSYLVTYFLTFYCDPYFLFNLW